MIWRHVKNCARSQQFFFLGFHKSPVCFPGSSTPKNESISAAARSVGKTNKQPTTLALPDRQSLFKWCLQTAFLWGLKLLLDLLPSRDKSKVSSKDPWHELTSPGREKGREQCMGKLVCLMELAPETDVLRSSTPQRQSCSG